MRTYKHVGLQHNVSRDDVSVIVSVYRGREEKMPVATPYAGGPQAGEEVQDRHFTETLVSRTPLLDHADQVLMTLYLYDGHSYRQIARLIGASATTVARRIRRIVRQLMDETYPLCLANRSHFSRLELILIRDHFVRGQSCTHISQRQGLTYYRVRTTILKAKRFANSILPVCSQTGDEENRS